MNNVRGALLAGGRGQWLGVLTQDMTKALVPYGGTCRLMDFSLANCLRTGVGEVVLMANDRQQQVVNHVVTHWTRYHDFHVHLGFQESLCPRHGARICNAGIRRPEHGTADALLANAEFVFAPGATDILVLHADHVYDFNYSDMIWEHRRSGAVATIGVQAIERRFVNLFGMVDVDEHLRVRSLVEKPICPTSNLVFIAFALFKADVLLELLHFLAAGSANSWQHDISRDVIPAMLANGDYVRAYQVKDFWADIGTVERYYLGHMRLIDAPADLEPERRPRTLGPWVPAQTSRGVAVGRVSVEGDVKHSFLYDGARIGRQAFVSDSLILPGGKVASGVTVRDSIVRQNEVVVEDRIGTTSLGMV